MEPFIGSISLFAFGFAPKGWALCDGTLLPVQGNEVLYSLLGTRFGGNGRTTFGLPDLRDKVPNEDTQYYIAVVGTYPPRS